MILTFCREVSSEILIINWRSFYHAKHLTSVFCLLFQQENLSGSKTKNFNCLDGAMLATKCDGVPECPFMSDECRKEV